MKLFQNFNFLNAIVKRVSVELTVLNDVSEDLIQ